MFLKTGAWAKVKCRAEYFLKPCFEFGKFAFIVSAVFFSLESKAAQDAVVVTDGAMVYQGADFDSRVIGYFRQGQKVRASTKTFGPFYKVRFKQGVVGYVSDVDVVPTDKLKKDPNSKSGKKDGDKSSGKRPLFSQFQFGFIGAYSSYTEVINKSEKNANIFTYGVKISMPMTLFDGPFLLDVNAHLTQTAPQYYDDISDKTPTGTIMIFDMSLVFVLDEFSQKDGVIYMGAGPAVVYSALEIEKSGSSFITEEARGGGVFSIGFGYRMGPLVLKFEPRYYVEKSNYLSGLAALQFAF